MALVEFRGERENWRVDADDRDARVLSALRKIWDGRETIFRVMGIKCNFLIRGYSNMISTR